MCVLVAVLWTDLSVWTCVESLCERAHSLLNVSVCHSVVPPSRGPQPPEGRSAMFYTWTYTDFNRILLSASCGNEEPQICGLCRKRRNYLIWVKVIILLIFHCVPPLILAFHLKELYNDWMGTEWQEHCEIRWKEKDVKKINNNNNNKLKWKAND